MTDTTPLTVDDILGEAPEFHTILEVWRAILDPANTQSTEKITPQYAMRICSTYREINFVHMGIFRAFYFEYIFELQAILNAEIATDDECLKQQTAEEDVAHNSHHYLQILMDWQKALLTWELDWDFYDANAPMKLAAISEVHRMFFGEQGLTSLLDQIQFQFTEDDQALLAAELLAMREAAVE